ncbi:MAG: hypothetical protein PVI74_13400 [Syntrophobacterales bacterium]
MSYRRRRSRNPVSSKRSPALDFGQSLRDFRNDEIRARDERIVTCITMIAKEIPRAICGPGHLLTTTCFADPLDSGFANSYLS